MMIPSDSYMLVRCNSDFLLCPVHCFGSDHCCWDDRHCPACSIVPSSRFSLQEFVRLLSLNSVNSEAARRSNKE